MPARWTGIHQEWSTTSRTSGNALPEINAEHYGRGHVLGYGIEATLADAFAEHSPGHAIVIVSNEVSFTALTSCDRFGSSEITWPALAP